LIHQSEGVPEANANVFQQLIELKYTKVGAAGRPFSASGVFFADVYKPSELRWLEKLST